MTDTSLRAAIVDVVARVLQIPRDVAEKGVTPATVSGWDSTRHVELVVALEEHFGIEFDPDDVPSLTSLEQIEASVSRYVETKSR